MVKGQEPQAPDQSDWEDDSDDDWGDRPDEDPESVPSKKFWSLGMVVLLVIMVLLAIGLIAPFFLRSPMAAARVEAINNAKMLGLALLEFDQEFGKFPDETTVEAVLRRTGSELDLSGDSSNAIFRQLIAYGNSDEHIFWCKHPELDGRRPDNGIGQGEALEAGEVGFSYVVGLDSNMDPALPLLAAAMKIGTHEFHRDVLGDRAVVLFVDHSARALPIRRSDHRAVLSDGGVLFDTPVDLRHPER
jgi:hypothetical protein